MMRVLHSLIQRTAGTRTAVLGEEMTVAVVVIFFDNPCVLCWFRREGGGGVSNSCEKLGMWGVGVTGFWAHG